jgi:hypothetical protein
MLRHTFEGEIGQFRRRHLVPVPAVASLAELNRLIAAADLLNAHILETCTQSYRPSSRKRAS